MRTNHVDVHIVSSSQYYVFALVLEKANNVNFNLIWMYGYPRHKHTTSTWHDVTNQETPTLCIGHMKNRGPEPPCLSRINNFCALVKHRGLFDLGYNGPAYT
jgi:hypothetical protein